VRASEAEALEEVPDKDVSKTSEAAQ